MEALSVEAERREIIIFLPPLREESDIEDCSIKFFYKPSSPKGMSLQIILEKV